MKKLAICGALLSVSGIAAAQSSVTLFGVVDAKLQHGSGSTASVTGIGSSGSPQSSRWGLRGNEDLGGGMQAAFWLEAQFATDTGAGLTTSTNNQSTGAGPTCVVNTSTTTVTTTTPATVAGSALTNTSTSTSASTCSAAINGAQGATFNRRATVSLLGGFGELRLGRDYSVQYYNRPLADPFGNNGVGATQTVVDSPGGLVNTRVSNAIMYFLPENLGGFYGEAQYYFGENLSNAGATAHAGNGGGVRAGYKAGPVDVAVAYARTQYGKTATTGNITSSNIAGRWNFGSVLAMAGYYRDVVDSTVQVTGHGWQFGGIWSVGAGEIKGLFSRYDYDSAGQPGTSKVSLGYLHNLSKRTAVYVTYAKLRNRGGAADALNGAITGRNQGSSGYDLGVRTMF